MLISDTGSSGTKGKVGGCSYEMVHFAFRTTQFGGEGAPLSFPLNSIIFVLSVFQFPNAFKCLFFNKSKKWRPDKGNIQSTSLYLRYLVTWAQFADLDID